MKSFLRLTLASAVAAPMSLAATAAMADTWISEDLGVPIGSDPTIIHEGRSASGSPFTVFYRGSNGHLWSVSGVETLTHHVVGTPYDLGGAYPTAAPAAAAYGVDGSFRIFYRGSNGHLWYTPYFEGQLSDSPADLGAAYPTGATSVIVHGRDHNKIKVLYRGPSGHLYLSEYDGGPWWGPSWDLGGVQLTSDPAAVQPDGYENWVRAFYRGPDGQLWMSPYDGGQWWGGPVALGGNLSTSPAALSSGQITTIAYGDASGQLVNRICDSLATWCSWEELTGVYMAGAPAMKSPDEVFYRGANGHLFVAHRRP